MTPHQPDKRQQPAGTPAEQAAQPKDPVKQELSEENLDQIAAGNKDQDELFGNPIKSPIQSPFPGSGGKGT